MTFLYDNLTNNDKKYVDKKTYLIIIVIAVAINLLLRQLVMLFASDDEIKPPNGFQNLSFKEKIMHMLVLHVQLSSASGRGRSRLPENWHTRFGVT